MPEVIVEMQFESYSNKMEEYSASLALESCISPTQVFFFPKQHGFNIYVLILYIIFLKGGCVCLTTLYCCINWSN